MTAIGLLSPWPGIGWRKPRGRRLRQARTTEESLRRSDSESVSIVLDLRDILAPSTEQVRGENGIELVDGPAVVVTGAMRGADAPGADGPANLVAAIRTASAPAARGLGVLVVLNDEIHSARRVEKMHTALPSAFTSPGSGPLGLVAENEAVISTMPVRKPVLAPLLPAFAPVAMVKVGLGDDGRAFGHVESAGYRGLVLEAIGAGHVPADVLSPLSSLAERMPVILTTRVAAGPVFTSTYGFPGSEISLIAAGLIPSGHLRAPKARLLLSVLIGNGWTREQIRESFAAC
ncbi:asparaginase domain-containing protein [Pelagibacterium sp.]|uniref:asparaginase domain-containing protein n=1 Tax=Pelagibacterium sp. TaxID=1967288 RepID=UPI003A929B47